MRDYKLLAAALNLNIPQGDLERLRLVLENLEAGFRPLASALPDEVEPAVIFQCPPEESL